MIARMQFDALAFQVLCALRSNPAIDSNLAVTVQNRIDKNLPPLTQDEVLSMYATVAINQTKVFQEALEAFHAEQPSV